MPTPSSRPWLSKLLRAAVVLSLALSIGLSLAFRFDRQPHEVIELLRYVPYLAWLLPAGAVFLASWWLGWGWRLAAALSPILIATGVMDPAWGQADNGSGHLRLMTYNVKSYIADEQVGGFDLLGMEIAQHDADVIVMQDADEFTKPDSVMPPPMVAALRGRQIVKRSEYMIASRLPLRNCSTPPMPGKHEAYPQFYLRCTVQVDGRDIDIVTVHFLSPRSGLNATRHDRLGGLEEWHINLSARVRQSQSLARDLARQPNPVVLAGDLNAPEASPVVRNLLDAGLRDAFSSAGSGYGFTHGHSLRPYLSFLRIDHILVSPDIGVREVFAGGSAGSAHRPVIADLLVKRQPR
jgi:endonuclease/exonuclease/phosphatase (EEP) superfamily protein YafD